MVLRPGVYILAEEIWNALGDRDFTFAEVKLHATTVKVHGPTMFGLYNSGLIERVSGERRTKRQRGWPPTLWRFTSKYREYRKRVQTEEAKKAVV